MDIKNICDEEFYDWADKNGILESDSFRYLNENVKDGSTMAAILSLGRLIWSMQGELEFEKGVSLGIKDAKKTIATMLDMYEKSTNKEIKEHIFELIKETVKE
jgi:rubrerythrin